MFFGRDNMLYEYVKDKSVDCPDCIIDRLQGELLLCEAANVNVNIKIYELTQELEQVKKERKELIEALNIHSYAELFNQLSAERKRADGLAKELEQVKKEVISLGRDSYSAVQGWYPEDFEEDEGKFTADRAIEAIKTEIELGRKFFKKLTAERKRADEAETVLQQCKNEYDTKTREITTELHVTYAGVDVTDTSVIDAIKQLNRSVTLLEEQMEDAIKLHMIEHDRADINEKALLVERRAFLVAMYKIYPGKSVNDIVLMMTEFRKLAAESNGEQG